MGFVQDVHVLMDLEEAFLKSLLPLMHSRFGESIKSPMVIPAIPRLPLGEALTILERTYDKPVAAGVPPGRLSNITGVTAKCTVN